MPNDDRSAIGDEGSVSEEEAPIIKYVHMVISEALKRRASDIHMEPLEKRFRVRYRIDGVLHEVENPTQALAAVDCFAHQADVEHQYR